MTQALIYSFKIWLTTFIIAPILAMGLIGILFKDGWFGVLFWYPRILLGGFIASCLSAGLLAVAVHFIKKTISIQVRKVYFTIATVLFTAFSFYLVSGIGAIDKDLIMFFIAYTQTSIAGVWLYKLALITTSQYDN